MRADCLRRALIFFILILSGPLVRGQNSPNILLLLADDLGIDLLDSYGHGTNLAATPNIDSLAQNGVLFRNAWVCPLCSPSRALIQTGRLGFRTGIGTPLNSDVEYPLQLSEIILPELLDIGTNCLYRHAAIGKWHLGNSQVGGISSPNTAGYEYFSGTLYNLSTYDTWTRIENGTTSTSTVYPATDKVDTALAWVNSVTEPFFLYVPFHLVHNPIHAPPSHLHNQDLSNAGDPELNPGPYAKAMVEAMDTEIGRLLAGLGSRLDETLVIFLGDNGTREGVLGPPFPPGHGKRSIYQGGINVPFIISGPQVQAPGSECDALINGTDIYATIAEVAGIDLAAVLPSGHTLDSISLVPYLSDPTQASLRPTVFTEAFKFNGPNNGVPDPPPAGPVCQEDLGFGGPGNVQLTVCGEALINLQTAELLLTNAPPNSGAVFVGSLWFNPTPIYGGMLTPIPPVIVAPIRTDSNGEVRFPGVTGALGLPGVSLYLQAAVVDPAQTQGFAISNTVRLDFLSWITTTMRNDRYKLIWRPYLELREFYNLGVDPWELTDLLLAGGLTPEEQANLDQLEQGIRALLGF